MKQLDLPPSEISLPDVDKEMGIKLWEIVPPGHKIGEPKPLFVELVLNNGLHFPSSSSL